MKYHVSNEFSFGLVRNFMRVDKRLLLPMLYMRGFHHMDICCKMFFSKMFCNRNSVNYLMHTLHRSVRLCVFDHQVDRFNWEILQKRSEVFLTLKSIFKHCFWWSRISAHPCLSKHLDYPEMWLIYILLTDLYGLF